jgi:hypothetical protein
VKSPQTLLSDDGRWFWDGQSWNDAYSSDRRWHWNGFRWEPTSSDEQRPRSGSSHEDQAKTAVAFDPATLPQDLAGVVDSLDPSLVTQYLRLQIEALERQRTEFDVGQAAAELRKRFWSAFQGPTRLVVLLFGVAVLMLIWRRGVVIQYTHPPLHNWLESLKTSSVSGPPGAQPPVGVGFSQWAETIGQNVLSLAFLKGLTEVFKGIPLDKAAEYVVAAFTIVGAFGLRTATFKVWVNAAIVGLALLMTTSIFLFAILAEPGWPPAQVWPSWHDWPILLALAVVGALLAQSLGRRAQNLNEPQTQHVHVPELAHVPWLPRPALSLVAVTRPVLPALLCPGYRWPTMTLFTLLPFLAVAAIVLDLASAKGANALVLGSILVCLVLSAFWCVWAAIVLPSQLRVIYAGAFIWLIVALVLQLTFPVLVISSLIAISVPIALWRDRERYLALSSALAQAAPRLSIAYSPVGFAPNLGAPQPFVQQEHPAAPRLVPSEPTSAPPNRARWMAALLVLGAVLAGLVIALYVVIFLTYSDPDTRAGAALISLWLSLVVVTCVVAAVGLHRASTWSWALTLIATGMLTLSIGIVLVPFLLFGLIRSYGMAVRQPVARPAGRE